MLFYGTRLVFIVLAPDSWSSNPIWLTTVNLVTTKYQATKYRASGSIKLILLILYIALSAIDPIVIYASDHEDERVYEQDDEHEEESDYEHKKEYEHEEVKILPKLNTSNREVEHEGEHDDESDNEDEYEQDDDHEHEHDEHEDEHKYDHEHDEELMVSLKVNYQDADNLAIIIKNEAGDILTSSDDLKPFPIKDEYITAATTLINNKEHVNLNKLPQAAIKYDSQNLALEVTLPAYAMQEQQFVIAPEPKKGLQGKEANGFFFNYDVTISHSENTKYITGIQDLNIFSNKGLFYHSFFLKRAIPNRGIFKEKEAVKINSYSTRLETSWSLDNPEKMTTWTVGDSVTRGADWSNTTRFAGIQYATDFSLQPDLITHPLINFNGKSDLPSVIDVYNNANIIYHGESRTGDFEIMNLPVDVGRGEVTVRTRDVTGKVTTFTIPYNIAPTLLAKGVKDFSFEAGVRRQQFGTKSYAYDYFTTSGSYMTGINDYWTSGLHFESLRGLASIGNSNILQIGDYGVINFSIGTNLHKIKHSQKTILGYNCQPGNFSYSFYATLTGKNYHDVYSYPATSPSSPSFQTSIGYNSEKLGNFSINFFSQTLVGSVNKTDSSRTISINYSQNITKNSFFMVTMMTNLGKRMSKEKKSSAVYISFFANPGEQNITLSNSNQKGGRFQQASISVPVSDEIGWGYRADLIRQKRLNYDLEVTKHSEHLESTVYLYQNNNSKVEQLELAGSLVFIDRSFYLTRPIYNSLALVKVGEFKGINVFKNNIKIGTTDSKGEILVPNIMPYNVSQIRLDPRNLPLDTNFANLSIKTAPQSKSGVIIDFGVTKTKSVQMIMIDDKKNLIPFDKTVKIEGIEEDLFIGYGGKLFINDIGTVENLNGKVCDAEEENQCCSFEVNIDKNINDSKDDPILNLGEVICK